MSTLALNSNNDLYFINRRLAIIPNNNSDKEILQRLKMRLKFFKDEWFLNSEHGVPYFTDILGTKSIDINIIESILRGQILNVKGVKEVTESSVDYNPSERKIDYYINLVSINNTVITEKLIVF